MIKYDDLIASQFGDVHFTVNFSQENKSPLPALPGSKCVIPCDGM